MKKLVWIIVGLALVLGGAYFYYTHKISSRLDKLAAMAGPMMNLEYDSVSIGLGGEVRINGLRLQGPNMPAELRVRQAALRADNLYALWSLKRKLENGEMPRTMGLALRGAEIPMAAAATSGQQPGSVAGLPFDAAGCGDRRHFTVTDLQAMGFGELVTDLDLQYEMGEYGQNLELRLQTHMHDMARVQLDSVIEMGASANNLFAAAQGLSRARLGSITLEYTDRGYYSRMLDYCGHETDTAAEEYVARHLSAWRKRWRDAGFEVGEATAQAYRTFLAAPGRVEITLDPSYSPALMQFRDTGPAELVGQFNLKARVNDGKAEWLAFEPTQEKQAVAEEGASDEEETRAAATAPDSVREAAPAQSRSQASAGSEPESRPRITGRVSTRDESSSASSGEGESQSGSGRSSWNSVPPRELTNYVSYKVDLSTHDGDEYYGRIERAAADRIHVHVRGRGGFFVIPVRTDEIASVRVRQQ